MPTTAQLSYIVRTGHVNTLRHRIENPEPVPVLRRPSLPTWERGDIVSRQHFFVNCMKSHRRKRAQNVARRATAHRLAVADTVVPNAVIQNSSIQNDAIPNTIVPAANRAQQPTPVTFFDFLEEICRTEMLSVARAVLKQMIAEMERSQYNNLALRTADSSESFGTMTVPGPSEPEPTLIDNVGAARLIFDDLTEKEREFIVHRILDILFGLCDVGEVNLGPRYPDLPNGSPSLSSLDGSLVGVGETNDPDNAVESDNSSETLVDSPSILESLSVVENLKNGLLNIHCIDGGEVGIVETEEQEVEGETVGVEEQARNQVPVQEDAGSREGDEQKLNLGRVGEADNGVADDAKPAVPGNSFIAYLKRIGGQIADAWENLNPRGNR